MVKRKGRIQKALVKRKSTPNKTKNTKIAIDKFNLSEASDRCKEWIQQQKHLRVDSSLEIVPDDLELHSAPYTPPLQLDDECVGSVVQNKVVDVLSEQKKPTETLSQNSKKISWSKFKKNVQFPCEWKHCHLEFTKKDEFVNHVSEHATFIQPNEDLYECLWDLCGFISTDYSALTRHLNFHTYHSILKAYGDSVRASALIPRCAYDSSNRNFIVDTETDYLCEWEGCYQQFNEVLKFFAHVKSHCSTHFKDKKQTCRWSGCGKEFRNYNIIMSHLPIHTKENEIACPHCGVMYRQNYRLYDHCIKQSNPETSEFQCDICGKNFALQRLLNDHKTKHKRDIKCSLCSMTFYSTYGYTEHIRYRHLAERPFSCTLCPYVGVRKRELDIHMQVHLGTTFECEEFGCNFTCTRSYMLKNHDIRVHGNGYGTFGCHICTKRYKRGQYLSRHLEKKHKVKHAPGYTRFTYRQFEDGIFRLKINQTEHHDVPDHKFDRKKIKYETNDSTISQTGDQQNDQYLTENDYLTDATQHDDDLYGEDDDEIDDDFDIEQEELKWDTSFELDDEKLVDYRKDMISKITAETDNCSIKSIDNFKVMKYLKNMPTNKIEIDIQSISVDGEIKSEKMEVDEIIL